MAVQGEFSNTRLFLFFLIPPWRQMETVARL